MLKKSLLITLILLSSISAFSQIKGGKIIVKPKVATYTLTVNSNVKPYTVYIDGRQIKGNRSNLSSGSHNVVVKSSGYIDYQTTVNLTRNITLNATLNPVVVNYTLTVNSNVKPYTVFIDGRQIKGNRSQLSSGNHSVIVKSNGYTDYQTNVNLNRNIVINAALNPIIINYSLTVNSNVKPYIVFVDGSQVKGNRITMEQGTHSVIVKSNGYNDYNTTVNLNRNITINASLIPNRAHVSVVIPVAMINNNVNGAIKQIRIFDNGMLLNGFNFELAPGNHTIRIESGGLVIEGYHNFLPGNTYKIEPVMYLNIE